MNINYKLWPNTDGNLGNIKVQIPTGIGDDKWPDGDALVGNFVYKNGIVSALVDTKALTVNDSKSTTFPYDYVNIQVDKSLEGTMTFNKGERTKYLTISYTTSGNSGGETFVIIDFNTTDAETINTVRTAKRVVDNKLYDANDNLIGAWDTSKLEVAGIIDVGEMIVDGLFCNFDVITYLKRGIILTEFNSDLSSLRDGKCMFASCSKITTFSSDLPSLTDGASMFATSNLTSFNADLAKLTIGANMFYDCANLESFSSNLSSLTNGFDMFGSCKLDTSSVQNIADTIKNVSGLTNDTSTGDEVWKEIGVGIGNSSPNEQEIEAFNTIASKGWAVYVNGSHYTPTSPAAITTLDENGEETVTPIPFWAKPVQTDEYHAQYVDENGNFYNILGAQFIYGDDLSTYGMFTCEEDAAANMRLTKIEKPLISKFAIKR